MPNQVRHDDLATFYDSIKQLKMEHQAIPGMTMNAYVKSKYGSPAVRAPGVAVFPVQILAMHVGEMAGMRQII